MEGFNPGQAFLGSVVNSATNIAQRDPLDDIKNDVDPNYLRNLEITSPGLFKDGKEEEPVDISDWLIPLDRAQVPLFGGAGNKVMDFLNREDIAGMPRYIRGVPAPSGVINRAPHIDSPYIDEQIRRGWKPIQLTAPGPQLPGFV